MTDSWDRPPPDPWGRAEQSTQYQDPWGRTQTGPQPWDGVPQEFQLPPSMAPPSVVPTVLVTALAGLFGLIPASLHAARARSIGLPGGRYWQAFGITFAIVSALWLGLILLLFSWLPSLLGMAPVTSTTAGRSTYATTAPSLPSVPATTTDPPRTSYSPPAPSSTDRSVTSLPSGSWVTVADSLAKAERSEADAWTIAKSLSRPSAQVVVVDTDAIPGLTPGYWAVAVIGSSSRAEAADLCPVLGRPLGGSCYPRQVG